MVVAQDNSSDGTEELLLYFPIRYYCFVAVTKAELHQCMLWWCLYSHKPRTETRHPHFPSCKADKPVNCMGSTAFDT